ncbi:hypothetical protein BKP64_05685 [Marinobacter salinus]|uniref:Uncharacterized protein n=1 Tax=Marinobacter salinus TaxID=1874317 RepID=A0A1D9GJ88_9GAMM|nr:hypothetical protein [Marinobacter salinus]AOY87702.1 hypothetical protein BKP64_05685 [Marinobacter salinus]
MNPELSFAQNRLNQLTEQLLSETPVTGDIIFFANDDAGGISGATWRFEDEDHALLKDRNVKFMLMELLNTLIQHRAGEGHTNTLHGIVHLEKSSPSIQWLTSNEAEQQRNLE